MTPAPGEVVASFGAHVEMPSDVLEQLMVAYCDATDGCGKQPEFPLEVRTAEK
jgi:hypothetical protein